MLLACPLRPLTAPLEKNQLRYPSSCWCGYLSGNSVTSGFVRHGRGAGKWVVPTFSNAWASAAVPLRIDDPPLFSLEPSAFTDM